MFTQKLVGHPILQAPAVRPDSNHAWHQYCIRTEDPASFIAHFDSLGIDARQYYTTPCHQQHVYKLHSQYSQRLENTDMATTLLVAIPVMHELTKEEIQRIVEALQSYS